MENSQPKKMKAIVQDQPGGRDTLKIGEVDLPIPNEDQALIKVMFTAINRADIGQRQGSYPPPPGVTKVLGLECSGYLITDLSQTENGTFTSNDKVMALLSGGGYAQYAIVNKNHIIPVPKSLSLEQAGAIPEVWLTAFQLLVEISKVKENDFVLIHAAASGVGTSLIQLCKKFKAKSIAVSSSNDKLNYCKELGADFTINYKENPDYSQIVQEFTNNKGANIVLDPVGAQNFFYVNIQQQIILQFQNLNSIAMDGRWVIYGGLGGSEVEKCNLGALMRKRVNLHFTTLRNRSDDYKTNLVKNFTEQCIKDFEEGTLKPIIDKMFKLSEIAQGHEQIEKNENIGKILLENDL